jgi:hypothetical protein
MLPQSDIAPTPVERIPTVEEHLEAAFHTHGYQQEAMAEEYLRVRREALAKIDEDLNADDAFFDVKDFLSKDESRRKAAMALANNATSPIVSRETQVAMLKQLIQDFFRGKKRAGLSALTALKAAELINKMCGYDAPVEQKLTHEHKVMVMPVISQAFTGELPPLRVTDVNDDDGRGMTSIASAPDPTETPLDKDLNIF